MKVEYIDHLGSDLTVANAARVSFDSESDWEVDDDGGVDLPFRDQKLIKYLATHNHWTPFSHCMITLRETVPIFVARQRFKHMVGFTYNEISRRYVDSDPAFYTPDTWRGRAENKKQGSSDVTFTGNLEKTIDHLYEKALDICEGSYRAMLASGVAPEQARMVLPQSMYTSYYVTGSLAAFARAYKLRSSLDSQLEIQTLATQWHTTIQPLYPHSWSALVNATE